MNDAIVQEEAMSEWLGWHWLGENGKLAHGDRRKVVAGETLAVEGPVILCSHGLHASRRAIDALGYAPGPIACRVRLSGEIIDDDDKSVGSERAVLSMIDATDVLRAFSRWCALEVAHLWEMPDVVRRYLETGDESLRAAAWDAARAAASHAASHAAWDAAWAAARAAASHAACDAASHAARAAACDAASHAARAAASPAAWDAEIERFNVKLEAMLLEAMGLQPVGSIQEASA